MSTARLIRGEELGRLLPHAGAMRLLDCIESWDDAGVRCTTLTHRDPHHPLRREGGLSAVHLIEYAAQAMALHGALLAQGKAQPGLLAAVRDARFHIARLDALDGPLTIGAVRRLARADGLLYEFTVHCGDALLSTGRIAVALQR